MGSKPPLPFRLAAWLAGRIGPEALRAGCLHARRFAARRPRQQRRLERLLTRATGRAPGPAELERATEEAAQVSAGMLATFITMGALPDDRIELAALPAIEDLRRRGRGVILASLHYGNYVLPLVALAAAKVPLTVIVLDGPGYRWVDRYGVKMVGVGGAGLDVLRALSAGEAVWVFCDLDYFPENRLEPFLGEPIRPPHGLARLSEASGAAVLPVYSVRDGTGWRLEADAPIPSGPAAGVEKAVLASMERWVKRHPAHWTMDLDVWDIEETDRVNRRRLARASRP